MSGNSLIENDYALAPARLRPAIRLSLAGAVGSAPDPISEKKKAKEKSNRKTLFSCSFFLEQKTKT
jgi:hypothetical protein